MVIFSHSFVQEQICQIMREHLLCTASFRSTHRFLVGFSSGFRLCYSKSLIFFCLSQPFTDSNVYFGSGHDERWNSFFFSSTGIHLNKSPSSGKRQAVIKNDAATTMIHCGYWSCFFLHQKKTLGIMNSYTFWNLCHQTWHFATSGYIRWTWMCFFVVKMGCCQTTLPHSADIKYLSDCHMQKIFSTCHILAPSFMLPQSPC